jgi:hypothetical protein
MKIIGGTIKAIAKNIPARAKTAFLCINIKKILFFKVISINVWSVDGKVP